MYIPRMFVVDDSKTVMLAKIYTRVIQKLMSDLYI